MSYLSDEEWRREQARINRERKLERRRYLHQRVRALHAEGLPTPVIATRLRVSRQVVCDAFQALGLTPNGHARSLPEGLP